MKKVLLLMTVMAVSLALIAPVDAACSKFGKIVASSVAPGGAVFILGGGGSTTFYYSFSSTSSPVIQALTAAQSAGNFVTINGNATACGTSGVVRAGGVVTSVNVF